MADRDRLLYRSPGGPSSRSRQSGQRHVGHSSCSRCFIVRRFIINSRFPVLKEGFEIAGLAIVGTGWPQ
jgi:hypothetical protein